RAGELAGDALARRTDDESAGADAEHRGDHALAARERAVVRRDGGALGRAVAKLDLEERRSIAHRDPCGAANASDELEERANGDALEAAANFARALEARFDSRARPEDFANACEDGARIALFSHVRGGARAELANALQEILFPREENHGDVAQRDVAAHGSTKCEAVELRHEEVVHDEIRR